MPFPLGVYVSPDNTLQNHLNCKTILAVLLSHCSPGDLLYCTMALSVQAFCTSRQKLAMVLLFKRFSILNSHCHEPCFLTTSTEESNSLDMSEFSIFSHVTFSQNGLLLKKLLFWELFAESRLEICCQLMYWTGIRSFQAVVFGTHNISSCMFCLPHDDSFLLSNYSNCVKIKL